MRFGAHHQRKIEINPDGSIIEDELRVDAPYELVVSFVANEMGHDLRIGEEWIARVKRAMVAACPA